MKTWSALFNLVAALVLVILSFAYINMARTLQRDFDQARLDTAVEYATQSTFSGTLEVEDIGIDYTDINVVSVNPGNSIDDFATIMCFSYDLSNSKENKDYIKESIAAMVLSGNDGFYLAQTVQNDTTPNNGVNGGEYVLKWSAKIPYLLKQGSKTYAVNLKTKTKTGIKSDGTPNTQALESDDLGIEAANSTITRYMVQEISNRNQNKKSFEYKFFLPTETTKTGVNPIKGPGILVLVEGAKYASSERINSISVSGYRTRDRVNVVAFTEEVGGDTRKYYCYEGQIDPADLTNGKYEIKNYFRNMYDAAKAGYSPHYGLLTKEIAKNKTK